ncbi:MAG: LppM family (lipo)protein [Bacilli bacterium]
MKLFKQILIITFIIFFTGCARVSMEIEIDKNDQGSVTLSIAFAEQLFEEKEEDDFSINPEETFKSLEKQWQEKEAKIVDYNFTEEEVNYYGKKVTINFKSLEELNTILENIAKNSDLKEENITEEVLSFKRENDNVFISLKPEEVNEEELNMMAGILKYNIKIKIDGKIISHNAPLIDNDNTLTWSLIPTLKEGINVNYTTSKKTTPPKEIEKKENNPFKYYIIGFIIILFLIGIITEKFSKRN